MGKSVYQLPVSARQQSAKLLVANSFQELKEAQWMQSHEVHLAHRERLLFVQLDAQQRTRCNNMLFRSILLKVFQDGQPVLRFLYLIKHNQRLARLTRHFRRSTDGQQDSIYIKVFCKKGTEMLLFLEVDISHLPIACTPEFLQ